MALILFKFLRNDQYKKLMPYFVMETLSNLPGLPGLFVSCVFSGSLRYRSIEEIESKLHFNYTFITILLHFYRNIYSTLSSGFNALATVTWDDLLKRYFRNIKDKKQLLITKFIGNLHC